jgi:hypothetical protein
MRREWTPEDLIACWTLLEDDRKLVANKAGATRLGFALLLKFFEHEGRFPRHGGEVPRQAVAYLAEQVGVLGANQTRFTWGDCRRRCRPVDRWDCGGRARRSWPAPVVFPQSPASGARAATYTTAETFGCTPASVTIIPERECRLALSSIRSSDRRRCAALALRHAGVARERRHHELRGLSAWTRPSRRQTPRAGAWSSRVGGPYSPR